MADTKEEISCPACDSYMKKIYFPEFKLNLDVCLTCGGIFFNNYEFAKFDEEHESIAEIENVLLGKDFKKVDTTQTRNCPHCYAPMHKNSPRNIEIDECYSCGAKFLDNQELQKYRASAGVEVDMKKLFEEKMAELIKNGEFETANDTEKIDSVRKSLGIDKLPSLGLFLQDISAKISSKGTLYYVEDEPPQ